MRMKQKDSLLLKYKIFCSFLIFMFQDPIIHTINWLDEGISKQLRLIDTPGVNDTRGDKQDEENFRKIQEFVESVG